MSPLVVADESVDYRIIVRLREEGMSVYAIIEQNASIKDDEVLAIANNKNALLITEDKDFGELTYRLKSQHSGILLLRILNQPATKRIDIAVRTIINYYKELQNRFSVLTADKLRIKE